MNKYKWSARYNAFFPKSILDKYVNSGYDLSDAIDIADSTVDEFNNDPPDGMMRSPGSDGMPSWVEVPPPSNSELLKQSLSELSSTYQKDVESLNRAWLAAAVNDGTSEISKKDQVLTQISDRKAKYLADRAEIISKYPV
ncbi:hypothetical protein [Citrobacter amalonaticus]|uniref:hypothetical protein n=1 Tax=Citrobacter amalonaticus TaxID=35703 RepID=UPI0012E71D8C